MTGKRRTPDPDRPGTVYRSKPKLGRGRGLSDGPPYVGGNRPDRSAATPPGGVGPDGLPAEDQVGGVYREYGGGPTRDRYGQVVDHRGGDPAGYGDPGGPGRRGYAGPPPGAPSAPGGRRLRRPRLSLIVLLVVLVLVGYPILLGLTAWTNLNRVDAIGPAHEVAEPAETPGRTYLVVGSDSRADLSKAERKRLGTGSAGGQRTDTIILLHVPSGSGPTVLISLPRDSYVPIPGRSSKNKINAAYAFGGPSLLIRTVEATTGLHIDEYVETGLGGFANIVDAVGGVTLCPRFAMKDKDAHINLKKGCQPMDGRTALGYARARHSDPRGDLGRVERQRETLAAIASKTLSPGTLLQPWRSFPAAKAGGGALTVDESTSPFALARFVLAMRAVSGGNGVSLTVPISNPNLSTSAGSAVQWDRTKALGLFKALKTGDDAYVRSLAKEQERARR
jgi:LCP family protein required for cell wall assembly